MNNVVANTVSSVFMSICRHNLTGFRVNLDSISMRQIRAYAEFTSQFMEIKNTYSRSCNAVSPDLISFFLSKPEVRKKYRNDEIQRFKEEVDLMLASQRAMIDLARVSGWIVPFATNLSS